MDADALASRVLHRWADGIARRDPDALAGLFTPDAVFVATAPAPLTGRAAIRDYYAAVPAGLRATASLVLARQQQDGLAIAADVVFHLPEGSQRAGRLCLSCTNGPLIRLYHLALDSAPA